MPAIVRKIRVQGANRQPGEFGEPDEASIGERHRQISVSLHEAGNGTRLLVEAKADPQYSLLHLLQKPPPGHFCPLEQKAGLGQYGLASQYRRCELFELLDRPGVPRLVGAEIRDERAGIHQGAGPHRPNPSMYLGFVA